MEYAINYVKTDRFLKHFSDIRMEEGDRGHYLAATYDGTAVRERISDLDYRQYEEGLRTIEELVHKYMAYLSAN